MTSIKPFYILIVLSIWLLCPTIVGAQEPTDARPTESVYVRQIQTDPSDILSDDEIGSITRHYEGRTVGITELQEIVDQLNLLYVQKGYRLSRAILPPQKIENGRVVVRLVEVRVGAVVVKGNVHTREAYFLRRMSLHPGDLLKLERLDHDLVRFNAVNDVQLRAQLQPGGEFGTSDYVLTVVEPRDTQLRIFAGNGGRTETGRVRGGLTWLERSLFGMRDRISVSHVRAEGATSTSLSYSILVGSLGNRLEVALGHGDTRIVAGTVAPLNVTGRAYDVSVSLRVPLKVSGSQKMESAVAWKREVSDTYFSGAPLLGTRVSRLEISLDREARSAAAYHRVGSVVTAGWAGVGSTPPFFKYNGEITREQSLEGGRRVRYLGTVQVASKASLPSTQQLSLGGTTSVRGYSEGEASVDSGYSLRVELHGAPSTYLSPYVFLDHGGALGALENGLFKTTTPPMTSAGFGANLHWGARWSGNLNYGLPLRDRNRNVARGGRLHARVEITY